MHPIEGRATELSGTLDVELSGGTVAAVHGGRIEVPVRSLRSGNPLEDAELQRRTDARRFPTIVGEIRNATPADGGHFDVEGEVTFHGATESVAGRLLFRADGDRLLVEGEHVFDVRRFGIKPPRILMLRVEPEVRVGIALAVERV